MPNSPAVSHKIVYITSFDPQRIWFSENTNINEFLLVARRGPQKDHTKIVKLAVNPTNEADAIHCAQALNCGETPAHCNILEWPNKYMKKGDWTATQFYSNLLVHTFMVCGQVVPRMMCNTIKRP